MTAAKIFIVMADYSCFECGGGHPVSAHRTKKEAEQAVTDFKADKRQMCDFYIEDLYIT